MKIGLGLLGILVAAPFLFSQRSASTTYDSSRQVKLEGVVTRIDWVNPNAFFFIAGSRFSIKLVDAQFPPYAQVIPQTTERAIRVPRASFAEALRAVSLAASDRTGGVKLEVTKSAMRITSESPETGDGFDEVPVDYAGPDVVIGFNAKYFLDVLSSVDDEEVVLGIGGDLDPAVIKPASESDERSYKAVVMPMRI